MLEQNDTVSRQGMGFPLKCLWADDSYRAVVVSVDATAVDV